MKKTIIISVLVVIALCLALCVTFTLLECQPTLEGTDALIEKAREEIPVADSENIDINYAGLCAKEDSALIWFISGNEYQSHYYLPMECKIVGKDAYTFERVYKPIERGIDIAVLQWQGGYAFLVNNPDCKTIRITDNTGTHDISIEKDAYPYIHFNNLIPSEYFFLDADGKVI